VVFTLSRDFSIKTLTEVTLSWKTEYLDGCSTAVRYVMRKVTAMKGGLKLLARNIPWRSVF